MLGHPHITPFRASLRVTYRTPVSDVGTLDFQTDNQRADDVLFGKVLQPVTSMYSGMTGYYH